MQTSVRLLQGCVIMTVLATSKAYHYPDSYSVTDEVDEDDEDSSEEKNQQEDYTKYFGGSGGGSGLPHSTAQTAADTSAGFVQPIEFSNLFAGNNFGSSDSIRGVIAPPTANNVFGLPAAPVLPGLVPGLSPSATNHNHSSHIGFINPNPNVAFHSLFDSSGSPSGPIYQQHNLFNPYSYPKTVIQPATSHSLYLPRFEIIKDSVTRDVADGQRLVSQTTKNEKIKRRPPINKVKDAHQDATGYNQRQDSKNYDNDDDVDNNDEEDSEDEDEDDSYVYDEPEEKIPHRQASLSEPHPGKSSYPVKSKSGYSKQSPFQKPYPYKPPRVITSESRQRNKSGVKQQSPYKKEPLPLEPDYGFSGAFNYPKTGLDDENKRTHPRNPQQTRSQEIIRRPKKIQPGFQKYTKPNHSHSRSYQTLNTAHKQIPQVPVGQTIYPTFVLTPSTAPVPQKNIHSAGSMYSYDPKGLSPVTLHGDFVPSASIPFAENYPNAYKLPYSSPIEKPSIPSSILPTNPQIKAESSEVARNTKRCTKIEKNIQPDEVTKGRVRRQPMTCYKCHDIATGANYEQCSYDSESKPKSFYETQSQKIKAEKNVEPYTFRKKRDTAETPYDFSFSRDTNVGQSVTLVRKVRQYTEYDDSYETPYSTADEDNYRFGPEHFKDGGEDEEGESTQQAPESENDEQCRKIRKDGIICMVCQKPSGGTYEQCSYASDPKENSYSYGTSRTYGHGSRPQRRQKKRNRRYSGIFDEEKSRKINKVVVLQRKARQNPDTSKRSKENKHDGEEDEGSFENPEDFSESVSRIRKADKKGGVGLDPFFYGSPEETYHPEELEGRSRREKEEAEEGSDEEKSASSQESESSPTYEDYFSRLFPELASLGSERKESQEANEEDYDSPENSESEDGTEEETKQTRKKLIPGFEFQSSIPEYFDDTEQRKDLEKVLGEFTQKDRSACKKVMRDKMTCYQCLDDKGMQHEECMFVAASEPKSKHLAYHEVKQFRLDPNKKEPKKDIEDKLANRKPVTFDNLNKDPNYETSEENENFKNKRKVVAADSNVNKIHGNYDYGNSYAGGTDNDSQAAENLDILRLQPKSSTNFPVSTVTIQNQRYFSSTGSSKPEKESLTTLQRKKRLPADDDMKAVATRRYHRQTRSDTDEDYEDEAEENNPQDARNKKVKQSKDKEVAKKPYNPIPTDPPNFNIPEGPEGAYSEDTEPAFDTVLKISLPRYMLERSEHEAIFDEVLASG